MRSLKRCILHDTVRSVISSPLNSRSSQQWEINVYGCIWLYTCVSVSICFFLSNDISSCWCQLSINNIKVFFILFFNDFLTVVASSDGWGNSFMGVYIYIYDIYINIYMYLCMSLQTVREWRPRIGREISRWKSCCLKLLFHQTYMI